MASNTVLNSDRGMPIMSQITRSGNGAEIVSTRSTSPFSHMSSMTSVQMRSTESSTDSSRRGVKARETMPRWRACRGSSMLMNDPKNSMASAGMSGIDTAPWPEQNSLGWRLISTISSSVVTAWKVMSSPIIPVTSSMVVSENGPFWARSAAKSSIRSCSGRRQNIGSDRSKRGAGAVMGSVCGLETRVTKRWARQRRRAARSSATASTR